MFIAAFLARILLVAEFLSLAACNVPTPPAPYDVTVVSSDGGMPCGLADAISQARLIRDPDSGLAVKVPCPETLVKQ